MVLSGIGSILVSEIANLATQHLPVVQQVAKSTAVEVAKKSFDLVLDRNPTFAGFLSHFGIGKFNNTHHKTFTHRGRHKRIIM